MNDRQSTILKTIIAEHIKTGLPVSSSSVSDNYSLNVSSATVRNEMADLEDQGYIVQPHTSAGRIPTEVAYKWFATDLPKLAPDTKATEALAEILNDRVELNFKLAAKALAELSGQAVFWAIHRHNVYYTGLTNLLSQPEFFSQNLIYDLSATIDRLDEIVNDYFDQIQHQTLILVGSDGPFGNFCSSILVKYKVGEHEGAFGLLGPLRQDYQKNIALIKYVSDLLCQKK